MSEEDLLQRVVELERKLTESEQTVRALLEGEVDTLVNERGAAPFLPRAAQAKLRDNQHLLRAVFDGATDAMLIADDDRRYVDANPAACVLFGLEKKDLVGRRIADFTVPGDTTSERWTTLIDEGPMGAEFPILRPDGTRRDVDAGGVANVLPGLHLSVLRDVTDRRTTERELRQAEQRLRAVIASTPIVLFAFDRDGIYTLYEGSGAAVHGLRSQGKVGDSIFTHFGRLAGAEAAVRRALSGESAVWEGDTLGGWFEVILVPVVNDSGVTASVTGVAIDVSLRKNAESDLRTSELRYRRIVENTSEGVWMYNAAGITTFMNRRMAEMLGSSVEASIGQPIFAFMDEASREDVRERIERWTRGVSARGEFRLKRRDGAELWVSLRADPLFDLAGNFESSLALVTDVTERRGAEDARNRLASIVESTDDAIISNDLDGSIASWNWGAERLFQWSTIEARGRSASMLIPPGAEEDERHIIERIVRGEVVEHHETQRLRKDGSIIDVALTVSPIRDYRRAIIGFSTIARDLTDHRKAEGKLRRTEDQLRQAQKMEAIGVLAGGIAHDFNNLLSIILSYTDLIVQDLKPADPLRADLSEVHKAGLRATQLTRQLLAFSRQQVLQPVVLDMTQVVSGVETMLARLLGEEVELLWLTSPSAGKVHADAGQIEQVIMNLVVNARDAMPDGGSVTIETANISLDENYANEHAGVAPGRYVMLAVTDTGTGMDAATKERIFEPFFTTKDKSKGTGLGLSTVYGIVQQSGGHIAVQSEPGKGTSFRIYLPRTDRALETQLPSLTSTLRGTETVLLVEDEDQVRAVMRSILRKNGYRVLEAQNAGEAFLVSEQFTAEIHLLLTDVVMPRMGGRQLAERLSPLRPGMKVLYVSGYTDDAVVHRGVLDAEVELLQKPIMPEPLLRKVRQVLDLGEAYRIDPSFRGPTFCE